jgi:MYXO-CTERM domain-containing protein
MGIGALAVVGALEERAQACSCFAESTLVAPVGDTHPRDASLVYVSFCGGSIGALAVTVDGEPATLQSEDEWQFVHAVDILPAPPEGAEVVISECQGWEFAPCAEDAVWEERARFVIGPLDEQSPAEVEDIGLDQEEGEFFRGCEDATLDLRLHATVQLDEPEPGTWVLIEFERDGDVVESHNVQTLANGDEQTELLVNRDDWKGSEVCATATVLDASGNASDVQRDCDRVSGCACTTGTSGSGPWLAAGVVLLLLRARRRRIARGAAKPSILRDDGRHAARPDTDDGDARRLWSRQAQR